MGGLVPNSRPQAKRELIEKILAAKGIDRAKYPVCLVAIRGYYLDSMGVPGKNDRMIYDDAGCVISPTAFVTVNFNTDPNGFRKGYGTAESTKGMACLKEGVWLYKIGTHKSIYPAMVQADKVTVVRDGSPNYDDTGYFGINHHPGGANSTSSIGCQTVPPPQWRSYIDTIVAEGKRYGQKVFPYILIDEFEKRAIDQGSAPLPVEEAPVQNAELNLAPALTVIKEFEGCYLKAYRDPVGIPTIGWGTIKYPNGRAVQMGEVISQAQADEYLMWEVKEKTAGVTKLVTVPCTNNEICALISFAYNVGTGALGTSTLLKKLNGHANRLDVANEFLKWVYAGGTQLPGLVRRRRAERDLFLTPERTVHS